MRTGAMPPGAPPLAMAAAGRPSHDDAGRFDASLHGAARDDGAAAAGGRMDADPWHRAPDAPGSMPRRPEAEATSVGAPGTRDMHAGSRARPSGRAATSASAQVPASPTHEASGTTAAPAAANGPGGSRAAPARHAATDASAGPPSQEAPSHPHRSGPAPARIQADGREGDGTPSPHGLAPPAMPAPQGVPGHVESRTPAGAGTRRPGQVHAATARATDRPRAHDATSDGVPLQALLAAAHPLAAPMPPAGDAAVAASSTAPALTPHDVAASVQGAWLRETRLPAAGGVASQWTFALGDPLTPLAALRVSAGAHGGWALQLTAGHGLPASQLAAHAERLRQRLRARGQAVERLEVDDDTENPS